MKDSTALGKTVHTNVTVPFNSVICVIIIAGVRQEDKVLVQLVELTACSKLSQP